MKCTKENFWESLDTYFSFRDLPESIYAFRCGSSLDVDVLGVEDSVVPFISSSRFEAGLKVLKLCFAGMYASTFSDFLVTKFVGGTEI